MIESDKLLPLDKQLIVNRIYDIYEKLSNRVKSSPEFFKKKNPNLGLPMWDPLRCPTGDTEARRCATAGVGVGGVRSSVSR